MTPKYKVGDTVYYVNGQSGERKATVNHVSTEYLGLPYTEPLYRISWLPSGGATVHESQLTTEPREGNT